MNGLLAEGQVLRFPPGAQAVPRPAIRPLPGAPAGLLGLAAQGGRLLPAWALDARPEAWVGLPEALLGGAALAEAPEEAALLRVPPMPLRPALPLPEPSPAAAAAPVPAPPAAVVLRLGAARLMVPLAALAGIRPWPDRITPLAAPVPGALGYATTRDGAVMLLAPDWCFGPAEAAPPGHLAVLRQDGRLLGLPCHAVLAGGAGEAILPRLSGAAGLLAAAPQAAAAAPLTPRARRELLLCRIGTLRAFLPVSAVEAVIPPMRPLPVPGGGGPGWLGLCAHRGQLLPVADAGHALFQPPAPAVAPLLRLAGAVPVALAVSEVVRLHAVEEADIAPLSGDTLVEALAPEDGQPRPVLRAAALASPA